MLLSFPKKTQQRKNRLEQYMTNEVLNGTDFKCRHFTQCKSSCAGRVYYDGQLSHVGKHFDLELNGRPLRIVIVGQEYGHDPAKVDMAARTDMILRHSHLRFQSSKRTPHMKGTASMLRLLFGREPGTDKVGEMLFDDSHIYDGFALVNYLLCTATDEKREDPTKSAKGAGKGKSSEKMRKNCARHFASTLRILEPTLVVIQGQGVRKWIGKHLCVQNSGGATENIISDGVEVDALTFDHPSAGGKSGWWGSGPNTRYLREVVRPRLQEYMRAYV